MGFYIINKIWNLFQSTCYLVQILLYNYDDDDNTFNFCFIFLLKCSTGQLFQVSWIVLASLMEWHINVILKYTFKVNKDSISNLLSPFLLPSIYCWLQFSSPSEDVLCLMGASSFWILLSNVSIKKSQFEALILNTKDFPPVQLSPKVMCPAATNNASKWQSRHAKQSTWHFFCDSYDKLKHLLTVIKDGGWDRVLHVNEKGA